MRPLPGLDPSGSVPQVIHIVASGSTSALMRGIGNAAALETGWSGIRSDLWREPNSRLARNSAAMEAVMRMPGFAAEAALHGSHRSYSSAGIAVIPRTGAMIGPAAGPSSPGGIVQSGPGPILSGCAPGGSYICRDALDTCLYYGSLGDPSDPSGCCDWWNSSCLFAPTNPTQIVGPGGGSPGSQGRACPATSRRTEWTGTVRLMGRPATRQLDGAP